MPFQYAIATTSKRLKPKSQWIYGSNKEYELDFHTTPKDFAEPHKDGYKQLISITGEPISEWVPLNRRIIDHTSIKMRSRANSLPDYFGTTLQVGDYVLTHLKNGSKHILELQVCEVIGFVKQGKVRILPLRNLEQETGVLRSPSEIVQIPPHLLGDEPNGEWIPTGEELL